MSKKREVQYRNFVVKNMQKCGSGIHQQEEKAARKQYKETVRKIIEQEYDDELEIWEQYYY